MFQIPLLYIVGMDSVDDAKALDTNLSDVPANICGLCHANIAEEGTHDCRSCDQHLCPKCHDKHGDCGQTGETRSSDLSDISTLYIRETETGNHSSTDDVICSDCKNVVAAEYCERHKAAICDTCKAATHGDCMTASIQEALQTFSADRLDGLHEKMATLKDNINRLNEGRESDLNELENLKEVCKEEVRGTKREIEANLAQLEADHLNDIDAFARERHDGIETHLSMLKTEYEMLEKNVKKVEMTKLGGTKSEMLTVEIKASKDVESHRAVLEKVIKDSTRPVLTFVKSIRINDAQPQLNRFGIPRRDGKVLLGLKVKSSNSISVKTANEVFPAINLFNKVPRFFMPMESPQPIIPISGCTFMPTGDLFICYGKTGVVRLLHASFTTVSPKVQLRHGVLEAAVIDENTVIVSLRDGKCLQYVQVYPELIARSTLDIGRLCFSVAKCGDEIITVCHDDPGNGEILILDLSGNIKSRFNCCERYSYFRGGSFLFTPGRPNFIAVNPREKKIHVSDADCRTLSCFTFDGELVSRYIPNETVLPGGLVVDLENNVFLVDSLEHRQCIHVIAADGTNSANLEVRTG